MVASTETEHPWHTRTIMSFPAPCTSYHHSCNNETVPWQKLLVACFAATEAVSRSLTLSSCGKSRYIHDFCVLDKCTKNATLCIGTARWCTTLCSSFKRIRQVCLEWVWCMASFWVDVADVEVMGVGLGTITLLLRCTIYFAFHYSWQMDADSMHFLDTLQES